MKERPIIFNAEMVRAILDGSKTQTRRTLRIQPTECNHTHWPEHPNSEWNYDDRGWSCAVCGNGVSLAKRDVKGITCPFGKVGDRLWVRETWARYNIDQNAHDMAYRATTPDDWPKEGRWRPSIHMPRWASRILLEITDVRVERLNDISEENAIAEGVARRHSDTYHGFYRDYENEGYGQGCTFANDSFRSLWKSIYGAESWEANPWVWVIEFKRMEATA
ncbi:morphogenetic protein [Pectobacterium parmentieri]|uniref:morphogenetic protein n=1 Tax=Pectobacterium parmentieri TaxID=1905730 RepID=UPI00137452E8|nr:morphogenetic protein [Pectobacterium parmentieri]QHQ14549.1 morphogenetic protein [Pectobacterium parmentieri]